MLLKELTLNKGISLPTGQLVRSVKDGIVTEEIAQAVIRQTIYWNDSRLEHWFFDFKVGDKWISSRNINNELTEFLVEIY